MISYVPEKCTAVIVVNWAEIGRSMTDRKFRVQSSLFRSLCPLPVHKRGTPERERDSSGRERERKRERLRDRKRERESGRRERKRKTREKEREREREREVA
jgi:hypothetical protein